MRMRLFLIVVLHSAVSLASFTDLIRAVRNNDCAAAKEILSEIDSEGELLVDINGIESDTGRRPIHYASSEAMLKLLFANGAVLNNSYGRIYVDKVGSTPLHVLFAESALILLQEYEDEFEARRRIEAAAYTILIAFRQEVGAGWVSGRIAIEAQPDNLGHIAGEYLRGPMWRTEFVDRLWGIRPFSFELGTLESQALMRRKRHKQWDLELELRQEKEMERVSRRELVQVVVQPTPIRSFFEQTAPLFPEFTKVHEAAQALSFLQSFDSDSK